MNRTKLMLLSALFVVGFIAPGATATWGNAGEYEPNTKFDVADYMYQTTPGATGAANPVYFSAFAATFIADHNPNTATLGSTISPTPTLWWQAVFGDWFDCNGDGFIGQAESAVQEYRIELILDPENPCLSNGHSDGTWVYEILTVGRVDECAFAPEADRNNADHVCNGYGEFVKRPGVVYTNGTKMWGDQGFPGQELTGSSCPIRPLARGTFSNTGMMLRAADCLVSWRIGQTLGFSDPTNPQNENHPLIFNTPVSIFGNPDPSFGDGRTGLAEQDTGKPTASVWDCSGSSGLGTPAVAPDAAADPTDASVFDAVDGVLDGLTLLNQPVQDVVAQYNAVRPTLYEASGGEKTFKEDLVVEKFDCNSSTKTALGEAYYEENLYGQDPAGTGLLEGKHEPSATSGGKVESSMAPYTFWNGGFDPEQAEEKVIIDTLGRGTPPDGGVTRLHQLFGPQWSAGTIYISSPQTISRHTLMPSSASYWSHYVHVDTAEFGSLTLDRPGGEGIYGLEACGEGNIFSGSTVVANGWNCNPDAWYPKGRDHYENGDFQDAVVGETYHFRDVDCFDGTLVRGVFLRASLTDVSTGGICDQSTPLPA